MNAELIDSVAARWCQLGAMLNVQATGQTTDIERLLLDTARVGSANSRIFILAASWLARYGGDYVAKQRLAQKIGDELEAEHRPVMGFLLEWAREHSESSKKHFDRAMKACGRAKDFRPLLEVDRRNAFLIRLAEQQASALSRKWGRWMENFELKANAIRPVEWITENNPSLAHRALTGGDLAASVLAECNESGAIESEAELARRCGASRPACRAAIRKLQRAGLLRECAKQGRARPVGAILSCPQGSRVDTLQKQI